MKYLKILFPIKKELKAKALLLANSRQVNEKPNATLKGVINEALEIGLSALIEKERQNLGALFQTTENEV